MTILWGRIEWFVSFVVAVLLATWMRHRDFNWPATISASLAACIILPLFISQIWADVLIFRRARHFAAKYGKYALRHHRKDSGAVAAVNPVKRADLDQSAGI
jgi:hypothetical protein